MKRIGVTNKSPIIYNNNPKTFVEWEYIMFDKVCAAYGRQVESFFPIENSPKGSHFSQAVSNKLKLSNTQKLKENR